VIDITVVFSHFQRIIESASAEGLLQGISIHYFTDNVIIVERISRGRDAFSLFYSLRTSGGFYLDFS